MILIAYQQIGVKIGNKMKNKSLSLLLLASLVLVGCDALSISPPIAESVSSAQGGWIVLTNPYDGQHLSQGSMVDVRSEASSSNKVTAAILLVNNGIYRRDEFSTSLTSANIYLPWTPHAPGVYTLQTLLEDGAGGQYLSNIITVYVDIDEEQITVEVTSTETPSVEIEEEVCAQPQATTHSYANCRSGPGTAYDLVAGLKPNENFPIIGRSPSGNWWQVQRDSGSCWLWVKLIDTCGELQGVNIIYMEEKDELDSDALKQDATITPTWDPASGPTGS